MRDLTLSQEYLLCAVNEKGRLPHLGVERTVCLVAAALLELQLEGCVAVDKKYVTVTGPLAEGRNCLKPYFSAFEQKQMKQRLRALGESPTGKMVQEMVEYVENMMAIAVGLIAVYS